VEVGRVINSLRKKKKKVKGKRKNYDKRTNLNAITFFFFQKKKEKEKREKCYTNSLFYTPKCLLPNIRVAERKRKESTQMGFKMS
jgi:hypothetical protein